MGELTDATFLSGWILTAGVAVLACFWWFSRLDAVGLPRGLQLHLGLSVALVLLYALHTGFAVPTGWIEALLSLLFLFLVASTVVGVALLRGSDPAVRVRRWTHVHVPLTYALLGAAVFHGAFVHGHGLLAHVFLGD